VARKRPSTYLHTNTNTQPRGFGWRIHCGVEVTVSSTNKQHSLGLDASAHIPHGASMAMDSFKALRPPDKEVGSDTAKVTRSAIQGSCVREWLLIWVCTK
jgi:hypothetical protein